MPLIKVSEMSGSTWALNPNHVVAATELSDGGEGVYTRVYTLALENGESLYVELGLSLQETLDLLNAS